MFRPTTLCVLALLILGRTGHAELRRRVPDMELVDRSELIVIGRIERGSVRSIARLHHNPEGRSYEHPARLVVAEVLKGTSPEQPLPIVIHHGLTPAVDGEWRYGKSFLRTLPSEIKKRQGIIEVIDTLASGKTFRPLVPDAGENHIWFLRRHLPRPRPFPPSHQYGIASPFDLQPLHFRPYFTALLAKNPDEAVPRVLASPDPRVRERALDYYHQQHRAEDAPRVAKLLTDPDPDVQARAAQVVNHIGDRRAVTLFRPFIQSKNERVRSYAIHFLCRYREGAPFAAFLRSPEGVERRLDGALSRFEAMQGLARCGSLDAVSDLLRIADSKGRRVNMTALKELTHLDFPSDPLDACAYWAKMRHLPESARILVGIQGAIAKLTNKHDLPYAVAYLRRITNQNPVDCPGERRSAAYVHAAWQGWFERNRHTTRSEWVRSGFAAIGLRLSAPISRKETAALVSVIEQHADPAHPGEQWPLQCWGYRFLVWNANRLLEEATGQVSGFDPYHYDGGKPNFLLARFWRDWLNETQ